MGKEMSKEMLEEIQGRIEEEMRNPSDHAREKAKRFVDSLPKGTAEGVCLDQLGEDEWKEIERLVSVRTVARERDGRTSNRDVKGD